MDEPTSSDADDVTAERAGTNPRYCVLCNAYISRAIRAGSVPAHSTLLTHCWPCRKALIETHEMLARTK